jgi:hypothetical protein
MNLSREELSGYGAMLLVPCLKFGADFKSHLSIGSAAPGRIAVRCKVTGKKLRAPNLACPRDGEMFKARMNVFSAIVSALLARVICRASVLQ